MKNHTLLILFFFISISSVLAQDWELGGFAGVSNYKGDISPTITLSESHPAIGGFVKKNVSPFFAFNLGMRYGKISGTDNNFKYLEPRGLSFSTSITELNFLIEFNFFPFIKGIKPSNFTPFVYSGIAGFKFDPSTTFNKQKIFLRDLGTEGQGLKGEKGKYSLYNVAIPIGAGFKYMLNDRFYIAFDVGFRGTFTDYLDDVSSDYYNSAVLAEERGQAVAQLADRSQPNDEYYFGKDGKQRGNPEFLDWYIFGGLSLSYVFKNNICYDF